MPTLRFEGYSDDTFGEYAHPQYDHNNCASGEPIEYLVQDPATGLGVVVTGQRCPGNSSSWMIDVADYQLDLDEGMPNWPMRFDPNRLLIEAPEGVVVRCLTRERGAG